MLEIVTRPTRYLFFTGKGGVGKTSLASAAAIALADQGKRVLLVSTDPASNLEHVFGCALSRIPTAIPAVARLAAMNIDPELAAAAYRERALGPLRGQVPDEELTARTEELSGACTVEIAAFGEFTGLLTATAYRAAYDHIVFDTAPTGHTLRLLRLPAAWSTFLTENPRGASCIGPHAALAQQYVNYAEAVAALANPTLTTLVLVTRPERSALEEAARTSTELGELAMHNQYLIINGIFTAVDRNDTVALALERRGRDALAGMPEELKTLPRSSVSLQPFNLVGVETLRHLLGQGVPAPCIPAPVIAQVGVDLPPLCALIDDLARTDRGLVLVIGKGGVGKTTIAAAVAVELAARGHTVQLTTTDPAAHVAATVEGQVGGLTVSRIDPAVETETYIRRALTTRGRGLSPEELALLREDLQSPCTEEIAVFHAFSRIVAMARSNFVVVDTAPTGHTLLLLDATGAYHRQMLQVLEKKSGLSGAVTPLMRIRNPEYTRILLVTLPETTPVQEAAELQADLRRAQIEPYAWVVNSGFAATNTRDPVLQQRALSELEQIGLVGDHIADRAFLVPWQIEEPVGLERLQQLTHRHSPPASVTTACTAG